MGLETATFISGLTASWPLAGDQKSVGDDHIRLVKTTLQSTFPTASKPFYFPSAEFVATTQVLDATDQNNTQLVDTTAGNVAMTLPTLTAADKGWSIDIIKTSGDSNAVIVSPPSGVIFSRVGSTATIRVGIIFEPATIRWMGSYWACWKPGSLIGSTENYDGSSVPPGYLADDGSAFSNTAFAELFAVLGSSTLRDKRGRAEIGIDAGQVNMSSAFFGTTPVLGATKVGSSVALGSSNMAPYTASGAVTVNTSVNFTQVGLNFTATAMGSGGNSCYSPQALNGANNLGLQGVATGSLTGGNSNGGSSAAFGIVPPAIVVNKIKRAC